MMQTNDRTVASELARYLGAAVLIRAVNDGATVGLALLALTIRPGVAGALVAALVAPHLLGPWLIRLLSWTDPRCVLAGAFILYGVAIGAAAVIMDDAPAVVTVLLVALAGCGGPMLAGGLTSRLPAGETARARAFDSATWGVATSTGPGLAAIISLLIGSVAAVLVMAAGAVVAAGVVLTLPAQPAALEDAVGVRAGFRYAARTRPLRTTLLSVGLAGVGLGAIPVATPLMSVELGKPLGNGGLLVATYGLTSLIGSLTVAARPLTGPPGRVAAYCLAVMSVAVGVAATAPSYGLALAGFAGLGLANGVLITAILALCRLHAPPGGHAQVLVLTTSVKIAGAALAGIWSGLATAGGGRVVLAGTALLLLAAGTTAALGRPFAHQAPAGEVPFQRAGERP